MTGKIFINYRREDSQHPAGRLYDQLEPEFGAQQIFIDVDHIAAGADFVEVLNNEVSKCDVMLSIIGKKWLGVKDQTTSARRLDNPDDFVRIEIEAALARGIVIIPVLVDGANMPAAQELPDSLKALSRRNSVRLTHERFRDDSAGLIRGIKQALTTIEGQRDAAEQQKLQAQQAEARRLADEKQAQERQMDDSAFQRARATNTLDAYRAYLAAFPKGDHAKNAKAICKRLKPFPVKATLGSVTVLTLLAAGTVAYLNFSGRSVIDPKPVAENSIMTPRSFAQSTKPRTEQKKEPTKRKVRTLIVNPDGTIGQPVERNRFTPGTIFDDCNGAGWCPSMVVVPKGSFMMGSPQREKDRGNDEDNKKGKGGKQVRVSIPRAFAVGRFEITNAEFVKFLNAVKKRGRKGKPWFKTKKENGRSQINGTVGNFKVERGKGKYPVVNVSWYGAKAYVKWLSGERKKEYRLLSEAEWEYVARAGTSTRYWWGDKFSDKKANNGSKTVPVDKYKKNAFGLYNAHGNVWEWVEDCYQDSYKGAPTDGSANTTGSCDYRVLRGGSWGNFPRYLRSATRYWLRPDYRNFINGFRVARSLPSPRTR